MATGRDGHLSDEVLAAWSDGRVTDDQRAQLLAHVASCDGCRTVLSALTRETDPAGGPRVGRYELREKVGAGGMGAVWSAWDPKLSRRVALKLSHTPRQGGDARFVHERHILAGLEHPHIARLLDAGETDEHHPWFAMDFVDGLPIDQHCERHHLGVRARVELMLPILAAVQHAHRHLVVHRDLKPANILVDAKHAPRLVDFGIARMLEADLHLTQTGHAPMTPAWASPEQVRGEAVTTSTDVFSLGVVLYELLAGVSPWRTPPGDVNALLRAIREDEPLAMSRATKLPGRARELAGDLDAVVAMSLRKDPKDRYASVDALAEDLRAWLDGAPTHARRGDRRYRFFRFVRRHRLAVGAAAAVFVSLSAGLVATAWQARVARTERDRATRRFEQVRQLAHAVLFDYHDGIADLPGSTRLRERLVKDALGYLDSLATEAQGDLPVQRELALAYLKVGDVQGDPFAGSLGDTAGARQSYLRGRALAETILAVAPKDRDARRALALSALKVGAIEEVAGKLDDAATAYQQSRALGRELLRELPTDAEVAFEVSRTELFLGQLRLQQNKLADAREAMEASVAARRSALAVARTPKLLSALATSVLSLSDVRREEGEAGASTALMEEALALFEEALVAEPDSAAARRGVQSTLNTLASNASSEGRHEPAVKYSTRAVEFARKAVAADPRNAVALRDLGLALQNAAWPLSKAGRTDDALAVLDDAQRNFEALVKLDPTPLAQRDLVSNRMREGYVALAGKRLARAELAFAAVRDGATQLLASDPDNAMVLDWLADGHYGVGNAARLEGKFSEALEALTQGQGVLSRLVEADAENARARLRWGFTTVELGHAQWDAGKKVEACATYAKAIAVFDALETHDADEQRAEVRAHCP